MTAPPPEVVARASLELRSHPSRTSGDDLKGTMDDVVSSGAASGAASTCQTGSARRSSFKAAGTAGASANPFNTPLSELDLNFPSDAHTRGRGRGGDIESSPPRSPGPLSSRDRDSSAPSAYASGASTPMPGTTTGGTSARGSIADPLFASSTALHPIDGGLHAWLFLAGATVIEILVYGFSFSIGVLHLYWTQEMFGPEALTTVTLASTLQAGMLYMTLGIVGPAITAFPRYVKHIQVGGLVIASAGLIATAFVTKPWHLIITIGFLYPCATAPYMPCCTILFEWFHRRRGFAAGIMYAGTGVGGTVFPFIITGLISRVGYRAAMVSIGVAFLLLGLVALVPIKRRIPLPKRRKGKVEQVVMRRLGAARRGRDRSADADADTRAGHDGGVLGEEEETIRQPKANLSFMRHRQVWIGAGVILISSAGNFIPTLWLPSFADDLGVSPGGTGLISIMNAASVPGNALTGYLSDRFPIHIVIIFNCVLTSLTCFFLWGFGTTPAVLVAFVLMFGLVGLSFASLWTRMISLIARDDPTVPAMAFTIFAVGRGIGSVTSGPIADALLQIDILNGAIGGYGVKNYGILLIYTGASILVAGGLGFAFTDKNRHVTGRVA